MTEAVPDDVRDYFARVRAARAEVDGWTDQERQRNRLATWRCHRRHVVAIAYATAEGPLLIYTAGRWTYEPIPANRRDGHHPRDVRGHPRGTCLPLLSDPIALDELSCSDKSCDLDQPSLTIAAVVDALRTGDRTGYLQSRVLGRRVP